MYLVDVFPTELVSIVTSFMYSLYAVFSVGSLMALDSFLGVEGLVGICCFSLILIFVIICKMMKSTTGLNKL